MFQFWERVRELDAYPKPIEDFRIKTKIGGSEIEPGMVSVWNIIDVIRINNILELVTIISSIIIAILFVYEFCDFLTPKVTEELFVDISRSHKLRINLDIEFPRVACSFLSLDAMDSSGDHQTSIEHNIYKRRLNSDGMPISDPEKSINLGDSSIGMNTTAQKGVQVRNVPLQNDTTLGNPVCGSCYGAESLIFKCCNTCEEVKEAYRIKGWAIQSPESIDQCKGMLQDLNKIFNEGCQIYGYMEVNRVSGSFHIAPGKSFSISHVHVHDVQPYSSSQFNMSHYIKSLTFGDMIPGRVLTNPMDGVHGVAHEESMMYQYYLKIVPTMYEKLDKSVMHTNQFSTTRHEKGVSMMSGESGMPGVFFSYDISPIMIKFTERRKSFGHFATSVCAIIGGIFTVAGILDSTIYKSNQLIFKKLELGKQG